MHYDVIVAGFGTSGSIAAVAAARQGVKVLVLEKVTYGGGTHTGGHICGYFDGEPVGLTAELNRKVAEMIDGSGYLHPEAPQEVKIIVYEQEVLKNGGEIVYEACITDVIMDGNTFKGVVWYDDAGRHEVTGSVLIDGSADAVFCKMAGCELTRGRSSDGLFQNFTNSSAYLYPDMHVWTANPDAGRMDQTCADEFSKVMLETATIHLRDQYSDEPHRLIKACDLPGLREGPRIIAETPLRVEDYFAGTCDLSEPIAWTKVFFDNHPKDTQLEDEIYQKWVCTGMGSERVWLGIPRGTIIPKGYNGILVAGRHLGVDHILGFPLRMNGALSKIGEAAGLMAALAVKNQFTPLAVPYVELEKLLQPGLCPLDMNREFFSLDEAEITTGLDSDIPGMAMWSAYLGKHNGLLKQIIADNQPESRLHSHAVLTLAMCGDRDALPELRKMVEKRDPATTLQNHRGHKIPRGYVAACFLSHYRDIESIPLFENILRETDMEHKFQYHGYAVVALLKIGDAFPEQRKLVVDILRPLAEDASWFLEFRLRPDYMSRRDPLFRIHIAKHLDDWGISHNIPETLKNIKMTEDERRLASRMIKSCGFDK